MPEKRRFHLRLGREYTLAICSGLLMGLAFPPYGLVAGLFAFVGLVPLLFAVQSTRRLREAFRVAWVGMFVFGLVATYWVGGWNGEGDVDGFLMLGGVLLMFVHPFFLIVPWLLYDLVRRNLGSRYALIALPMFYAGFEYAHAFGDLSFPWLSLVNTQTYNTAFIQFIEFTGPFALTMVIVTINILIYQLIVYRRAPKRVGLFGAALVFVVGFLYLYGNHILNEAPSNAQKIRVTVLQPNINPWAKWQADEGRVMDTNFLATRRALEVSTHTQLFIWPETAIPFPITAPTESYRLNQLYRFLDTLGVPLLTGFPDMEFYEAGHDVPTDAKPTRTQGITYRSWNAAMLTYKDGGIRVIERYHKQILVPLGEHVPFVDQLPFLGSIFKWTVGMGSWNRGEGHTILKLPISESSDTAKIATLICYESIYPSFVRQFVHDGAELLVIITNDGWYGKSPGPFQHNAYAVLRAVENRRWVARSANTGISSFVDEKGRFVAESPLFEQTSLTARVPLLTTTTFYAAHGDFIAIPAMWFSIAAALYFLVRWITTRRKRIP